MLGIFGKQCQSCGMPLKKDPMGGGSNANGAKSDVYCSYCYKDGKFIQNISVSEMAKLVEEKMKEMKIPSLLAKIFSKQVPKLKRWKE